MTPDAAKAIVKALREKMDKMPFKETTTEKGKKIALEVRRLERLINGVIHIEVHN